MSTADAGGPDGRAPAARRAEAWPDDAWVVALIAPPDAGRRACELAVELADASGADRRTLVANLAGGAPDLDGHLGSTAEEGLFDAGRSGRSLREIATRSSGRRFLYLPAGDVEAAPGGGGDADGGVRPRLAGLMARVAERVREKDGRLLLFLSGEGEWPEALPRLLDGMVLLAGAAPPRGWGEAAPPVLGLRPAEGEADDGAAAGDGEPGAWRRHRRSSGAPWVRIAAGAAAIVALAAGWWWLVREAAPGDDGRGDAAAVEITADPPGGAPGADGTEAPGGGDPPAPSAAGDAEAGAMVAEAAALPYSVLIASYAQWPQARRRLEAWRGPSEPVYFVAPTRIRGGLYWRLFAGAVADRATGEALMERLVDLGRKDRARAWDVRPVELAFLAGTAASRSAAETRVEALEERGVPAYSLPAVSGGDTAWAVYSGGFESEGEASELRALLGEAEIEGELVTRRGESDTR